MADDQLIFRDGLKRLLESEGFHVVGEAADDHEAGRVVRDTKPDLLLLYLAMPGAGGLRTPEADGLENTWVIALTAAVESTISFAPFVSERERECSRNAPLAN